MTNLNITSDQNANLWKEDVGRLNEETSQLLNDVGTALQEVKNDADSTIVDEIYKYGSQIISGSRDVLRGMNELVSLVTGILSKVNELLESGKGFVKGIINAIPGL